MDKKLKKIHPAASASELDSSSVTNVERRVMSATLVPTLNTENSPNTSFHVPKPYEPFGSGRCEVFTKLMASTFISKMLFTMARGGVSGNAITNSVTYPN